MLWHRGLSPPRCLSKEEILNPRVLLTRASPPPRGQFLSFWPFGPFHALFWPCSALQGAIPFILAFCAAIFIHFGLLGLDFCPFWSLGTYKGFAHTGLPSGGGQFLSFWPFGPCHSLLCVFRPCFLCSFNLWASISLYFGRVGLHFLAFWPCGSSFLCVLAYWASFPCILALWACISLQ